MPTPDFLGACLVLWPAETQDVAPDVAAEIFSRIVRVDVQVGIEIKLIRQMDPSDPKANRVKSPHAHGIRVPPPLVEEFWISEPRMGGNRRQRVP